MRRILYGTIAVLTLFLGYQMLFSFKRLAAGEHAEVSAAFMGLELSGIKGEVEGMGLLEVPYMTQAQCGEFIKQMWKELADHTAKMRNDGVFLNGEETDPNEVTTVFEEGRSITMLRMQEAENSITLKVITLEGESGDQAVGGNIAEQLQVRQYLLIQVQLREAEDTADIASGYYQQVQWLIEEYTGRGQTTLSFEGIYPGSLAAEQRDRIAQSLLGQLGAKLVEEYRNEEQYIAYAYSGAIADYRLSDGKKVNINLVIAEDVLAAETRFYLATPIVNSDY